LKTISYDQCGSSLPSQFRNKKNEFRSFRLKQKRKLMYSILEIYEIIKDYSSRSDLGILT
jgi:hypothetical protein